MDNKLYNDKSSGKLKQQAFSHYSKNKKAWIIQN